MARKSTQYPCGVCAANCGDDTLACDGCCQWFHRSCQNVTPEQLRYLGSVKLPFFCQACCRGEDGRFLYEEALKRLSSAAAQSGFKSLQRAVLMEEITLRDVAEFQSDTTQNHPLKLDSESERYLYPYGRETLHDLVPVSVSGDGNCLMNSISIALVGNESLAAELRLRICIDMVKNANAYQRHYGFVDLSCDDYHDECLKAAKNGAWSSAWSIAAAANVIRRDIVSLYPPVNGLTDMYSLTLTTVFKPMKEESAGQVTLLWARLGPQVGKIWFPNHFVPLIERERVAPPIEERKKQILRMFDTDEGIDENLQSLRSDISVLDPSYEFLGESAGSITSDPLPHVTYRTSTPVVVDEDDITGRTCESDVLVLESSRNEDESSSVPTVSPIRSRNNNERTSSSSSASVVEGQPDIQLAPEVIAAGGRSNGGSFYVCSSNARRLPIILQFHEE